MPFTLPFLTQSAGLLLTMVLLFSSVVHAMSMALIPSVGCRGKGV